MSIEPFRLDAAIAALQAQRLLLGDAVVDAAVAGLLAQAPGRPSDDPASLQALRQVSILFLDVVGSTRLSLRLDPEETSAVLDGALARGTRVVEAHAGRVLQYAGDNILAVFGADEAREDDAERAVRCGLALLALGRSLGDEVRARHGVDGIDVRVGIHSGDVLLGGGVDAEGSVRGNAVHIAARMEQSAPAGAVLISHDTHDLVRGLFEVEALPPMIIKGVDGPVTGHRVLRSRPRRFALRARGVEGVSTPMVGREAELDSLCRAFLGLLRGDSLQALSVVGEAGIGKSRLLGAFEAWSEAQPGRFLRLRGRAFPQAQGQPYGLLRDIVLRQLQIDDDAAVADARHRLETAIVPLFVKDDGPDLAESHAHLLGHLIGVEWRHSRHVAPILGDPRQIRNRAFHAAAQWLQRTGAAFGEPVLLEIEDLHWADGETLDFLAYLTEVAAAAPLLVVATSRPALYERRSGWCADGAHRRIHLHPLGADSSWQLAQTLLSRLPEVPEALRRLLIDGAEGNPFYMEELLRTLIDQGAIRTGAVWQVDVAKLQSARVPATLVGVLQARLDSLPAAEKGCLQAASVIGAVFREQDLLALDPAAAATCGTLVRRELLLPLRTVSGEDGVAFAFQHQLLHRVTYATLLKRRKRELHGRLAQWLASRTGLRANEVLGQAAEHFEQAGDDARAAQFHTRAAEDARARWAHEALLHHVQRGLALLERSPQPESEALRWRLLEAREALLDLRGDRAGQQADIDCLQQLAEANDDDRQRAYVAWRRSDLFRRRADFPAMEGAARLTMQLAARADDPTRRLMAQRMVATALAMQGRLDEGEALAREAADEARRLALVAIEGACFNTLGVIAQARNDDVAALELMTRSLQAAQTAGDRRTQAIAQGNVGLCWLNLGALPQARSELEAGLRLVRVNGDRMMECSPLGALAVLALWQGDDVAALAAARSALQIASAAGATDDEAQLQWRLGAAELALGRLDAAQQAYEQSLALSTRIGYGIRRDAEAGLAQVALARQDVAQALQVIEPLLALGSEPQLDGSELPRLIEWTCHRVLQHAGDPRADAWLRHAHLQLQVSARRIDSASLREGFLHNVPHHRSIVAAWAACCRRHG